MKKTLVIFLSFFLSVNLLAQNRCPSTVTDIDGNVYSTVKIGSQCWMKENLRTTHYADGMAIIDCPGTHWYGVDICDTWEVHPSFIYPDSNFNNVQMYGLLYNYIAAMHGEHSSGKNPSGIQGACPIGWHVPSDAEWKQLEMTAGMNKSEADLLGWRGSIAAKLSGNEGWAFSSEENTAGNKRSSERNITGFSALPAGGTFGQSAAFWSTSDDIVYEGNDEHVGDTCVIIVDGEPRTVVYAGKASVRDRAFPWAYYHELYYAQDGVARGRATLGEHLSVRCIYDGVTPQSEPSVGIFLQQLQPAMPSNKPCPPTFVDYDGNVYNTVKVGSQCWMKENLRTTHYADGSVIKLYDDDGYNDAFYYRFPDDSASNVGIYGLLYNWRTVMNDSPSSNYNPSGVQGICPKGWHVPSDMEWKQLEMTAGMSKEDADKRDWRGDIASKLCGNIGWLAGDKTLHGNEAGNMGAYNRNSTGFSALPAGSVCYQPQELLYSAYFWSATEYDDKEFANARVLEAGQAGVQRYSYTSDLYCSVRCVQD